MRSDLRRVYLINVLLDLSLSQSVVGHFHYTNLSGTNGDRLNVIIGICPGLRNWIACLVTLISCLIIVGMMVFPEKVRRSIQWTEVSSIESYNQA